jgi:hypothetical protein
LISFLPRILQLVVILRVFEVAQVEGQRLAHDQRVDMQAQAAAQIFLAKCLPLHGHTVDQKHGEDHQHQGQHGTKTSPRILPGADGAYHLIDHHLFAPREQRRHDTAD